MSSRTRFTRLLACSLLLALGCDRPGEDPLGGRPDPAPGGAAPTQGPRRVRLHAARSEPWPSTLRVTGELAVFEEATVSSKVAARVDAFDVDVGALVRAGDLLVRQETGDLGLDVERAEAALSTARARLGTAAGNGALQEPTMSAFVRETAAQLQGARQERDRLRQLSAEGVVTQALLDDAEARFEASEARWYTALDEFALRRALLAEREVDLRLAQRALADARILAPFDGAVAARLAGPGDYLGAGASVLRLVRFDPLRARLEVPERGAPAVRVGQPVRLEIEGRPEPIAATITRRVPLLEPASRTLVVEVDLPNPEAELLPGSFVRAEIVLDPSARVLALPAETLVRFAGLDKVVLLREGRAQEREVRIGRSEGDRVEVLAGLEEGEEVVLSPQGIRTGDALQVEH